MKLSLKISTLLSVAAAVALLLLLANSAESFSIAKDGEVNELKLLGTVAGRSYYADKDDILSWTEARAYCNANSLQIATVEASSYINFLRTNLNAAYNGNAFWVNVTQDKSLFDLFQSHVGKNITDCVYIYGIGGFLAATAHECATGAHVLCQS